MEGSSTFGRTIQRFKRNSGVRAAGSFAQWWGGELLGYVPAQYRERFFPRTADLLIEEDGTVWEDDRQVEKLDFDASDADGQQRFAALLARLEEPPRVVWLLDPSRVLLKRHSLPITAEDDLRRIIHFEMDKLTPFQPEKVLFDRRIVERHPERNQIDVDLAFVQREEIEQFRREAAQRGIALDAIDVGSGSQPPARQGFNFLPAEQQPKRRSPRALANWGLALLAAVLFFGGLQLSVIQRQAALEDLDARAASLRSSALEVAGLKQRVEDARAASVFLRQRKAEHPLMVELLAEMTGLLPDDVWLQRLQVDSEEAQLTGQAPNAAALVALLDQSRMLYSPTFVGRITPDRTSGKEKFTLKAQLAPEEADAELASR